MAQSTIYQKNVRSHPTVASHPCFPHPWDLTLNPYSATIQRGQEYSLGSLLTQQFSNGIKIGQLFIYLSVIYPPPSFCIKNTNATFVNVYFCPQRQYIMCVNIGPLPVLEGATGSHCVTSSDMAKFSSKCHYLFN